jgi:thiamine-phosphate pyrophosphorylase
MRLTEKKSILGTVDLYPVISPPFRPSRSFVDVLTAVLAAGVKMVQLRCKNLSMREILALAHIFRQETARAGSLFMVNDYVDIALAADADGVHLGQDDLPLAVVRKVAPDMLLGQSTHSVPEAVQAQNEGADYINLGPIFPTKTKTLSCPPLGIKGLSQISPHVKIPYTVMGGITRENIPLLLAAGARRIAVVTEITLAEDMIQQARKLREMIRHL